ncbi:Intraflagellar transport protein 81 homolog [Caenorhabditis elegans]|uniref:Intraflagellar transport protein 81 homolog n=1 Tax=Caenorhabditis elegans TaxID=6239 RepID=A8DYR7_CAEEL|nr:IFT81 calponin homology domain-containing protein [Caenorhabditis elegans]CCD65721.1 IFT81 calponin homology domain-containing protein [Caenorhabditis elegans]|eukprot:NP_508900.6 IFT (Chlamydomonas IntraFlagellar Transport) homolog [Caenorhabditis elegans]
MSNDIQGFILHFLNEEPFNLNLSSLQFDQLPPQQLLQILSNVLSWVSDTDRIDIKREAAEETAIRILNMLRILRYRPPQDQDEQEEWRAGIVEGRKTSLYPLLVFLFENSEGLKERAYLSKYLMKTDVPGEFFDYDIEELQNEIGELTMEFKEIHAEMKGIMADVLLLDDIKEDLKSMEKEKQILLRKIEKTEKKVQNIPYFDKQMQLALQLRGEKTRYADFAIEKQQERQKVLNIEARINRMKINLTEAQAVADTLDEQALMEKLEDEVATNTYLVNGKLFQEIESKENKLKELTAMARSNSVREEDVSRMNSEIEEMSKRIRKLEDERDHKEVDIDENMSVFRHQTSLLERKKETAVQKLQELRQELAKIEKDVDERKTNLKDKVGGEVVSNVQYRKYLEQYRVKSEEQKKKRKEIELMHTEVAVLKRTIDIVSKRYNKLETHIESIGGEIVEVLNVPTKYDRPKTAAPQTNNAEDIKSDMKDMMAALDERKDKITDQRTKRDEVKYVVQQKMSQLATIKMEADQFMAELERDNKRLVENVKELETTVRDCDDRIPELKNELAILLDDKNKMEGVSGENLEELLSKAAEKEQRIDTEIEEMGDFDESRMQAELWKGLLTIFETKIEIFKERANSRN